MRPTIEHAHASCVHHSGPGVVERRVKNTATGRLAILVSLADVTGSVGSTTGNGHSFFRQRPWVSSDLLALLSFDLDAQSRGLIPEKDLLVWRFPPDYVERLRGNISERHPELADRLAEPVGDASDD